MNSLEKVKIFTPLQKLAKECRRLGQINCFQRLRKVAQSPMNRQSGHTVDKFEGARLAHLQR